MEDDFKPADVRAFPFLLPLIFSLWAMGMLTLNPLLVLRLAQKGASPTEVGVFSGLSFLTVLFLTPWLPQLGMRFSNKQLFLCGGWLAVICIAGYALIDSLFGWFALALVFGAGGALVWALAESMIMLDAPKGMEGHFMGIYQTMMGAGFALGPIFAANIPLSFNRSVILISGFIAALLFCLTLFYHWPQAKGQALHTLALGDPGVTDAPLPPTSASPAQGLGFLLLLRLATKNIPLLLIAALVGGGFEAGLNSMGIVVTLPYFPAGIALYVPSVIGLGSLLTQYPMGRLADRKGALWVMRLMLFLLAASCIAFGLLQARLPWMIWALAPIWGACGGAMYTLAMTVLSQQDKNHSLVSSTGLLVFFYTAGGVLGPMLGGVLYQYGGNAGLGLVFGALAMLAGLAFAPIKLKQKT